MVLATLSSILAFSQTAFLAGARVLYTLGREGALPHRLGTVSARQTPGVGIAVMAVVLSMALGVPLAFLVGPFNVWGYFGFLILIAFLVSYIFTNFGLIRYMRRIGEFKPATFRYMARRAFSDRSCSFTRWTRPSGHCRPGSMGPCRSCSWRGSPSESGCSSSRCANVQR